MGFSAKDAGLFVLSGTPGIGSTVTIANPAGGTSTLLLPMASGDDGNTFDIAIYAVDSNGNPLTGTSALFEVQKNSTFAWNSGTNATFSRTAGNVVAGTAGAGTLVNFTGASGYRLAVSAWTSVKALAAMLGVGGSVSGGTNNCVLYVDGSGNLADSSNLQYTEAAGLQITAAADADTALVVNKHSGTQSADLAQFVGASGTAGVDKKGRIYAGGAPDSHISANVKIVSSDSSDAYFGAAVGGLVTYLETYNGECGIDCYNFTNGANPTLNLGGFNGGGNTGITRCWSGNAERWRCTSTGEMGVGTTSPESGAVLTVQQSDAATGGGTNALILRRHASSGTPGAGFGSVFLWELDDSTNPNQSAAYDQAAWGTATHASRAGTREAGVYYTTTAYPLWHGVATSTGPNLSLLTATESYGGGVGVVFLPNAVTNPSSNPTGGLDLYSSSGKLYYRGTAGVVPVGPGITTDVDGATVTFDMSLTIIHQVTLGGNRTLAVSNDLDGETFLVVLAQDATGSRTVTWWSGILWPGGTTPTLTTTAGKKDVFSFLRLGSGSYLGFTVGQNI